MQYMAGKMKICEYNVNKLYGCSGVLNALEDDCGCRKSSHFNWYIKKGQVTQDSCLAVETCDESRRL
jgi:hypothetical protein